MLIHRNWKVLLFDVIWNSKSVINFYLLQQQYRATWLAQTCSILTALAAPLKLYYSNFYPLMIHVFIQGDNFLIVVLPEFLMTPVIKTLYLWHATSTQLGQIKIALCVILKMSIMSLCAWIHATEKFYDMFLLLSGFL